MKEIAMSIPQFLAYERGEKTLKDIKLENGLESLAERIINNDKLRKMTVFIIAGLNYASEAIADTTAAVSKIDSAGYMILSVAQSIGYWLCLVGCIIEILKSVMNGTSKDAGKIMMKYILYFAALYLMPFAFNMIRDIFS